MLSRRSAVSSLFALSAARAQDSVKPVQFTFQVMDSKGRHILGLQQKDFRILEDGIVQKIATFEQSNELIENSYSVTYTPASNPNRGFRKIEVQIVSDLDKRYRVRSKPGYRPE